MLSCSPVTAVGLSLASGSKPIRVLTVHTDPNSENLGLMLESMDKALYNLTVVPLTGRFMYYHSKFYPIIPTLREIPDDEIILVVDGNDILFFPCERDLRKELGKFKADLVLAHAKFQHPDYALESLFPPSMEFDSQPFPNPEAKIFFEERRFMDSGVILCKAGALKFFLSESYLGTLQLKFDYPHTIYRHWDDQQFWTQLFLAQTVASSQWSPKRPRIAIDSEGLISQHFNIYNTYVMDAQTRYVTQISEAGKPLTKREICILQAPGGSINYVPMFHQVFPRFKRNRRHLWKSGEPTTSLNSTTPAITSS
ncbi:hypothetical protein WJX73_009187 [Symbiochloris irregularis]|uniref:Uncharacterized protein n=1 Tax=Symbiochloris irregularis TaxID=706552 RepID=A0AAW1P8E3_9CHLO